MMQDRVAVITGSGQYTPENVVTNEQIVNTYNKYIQAVNAENRHNDQAGSAVEIEATSEEFIRIATGIEKRNVIDDSGILNSERMQPSVASRREEQLSIQAEMGVAAALEALQEAQRDSREVDLIIVGATAIERPYPAIAIEIQAALGAKGFAYDMNAACSSATFAIQAAHSAILTGLAKCVLVINPEFASAQTNFRDPNTHYIFGDACSALVIEPEQESISSKGYLIRGIKLITRYSNAIRNDFGFLEKVYGRSEEKSNYFKQDGKQVFDELLPLVTEHITTHLRELGIAIPDIARVWMHQSNINMNKLITRRMFGRKLTEGEAPNIISRYANIASAGSIITFHYHKNDLRKGEKGLICSFGAGYSVGTVALEKM